MKEQMPTISKSAVISYKGESVGKRLARMCFWTQVHELMGPTAFRRDGRFLVLSSQEAGDVRTLTGLGVKAENIYAVDINKEAIEQAKQKAPGAHYLLGDVEDIVKEYKQGFFHVAHLDFCNTLGPVVVNKALRVAARALSDQRFLGLGLMYGRERSEEVKANIDYAKSKVVERINVFPTLTAETYRQRLLAEYGPTLGQYEWEQVQEMASSEGLSVDTALQRAQQYMATTSKQDLSRKTQYIVTARARMDALSQLLLSVASPMHFGVIQRQYITYHSRTESNHGVPMIFFLGEIFRPPGINRKRFAQKLAQRALSLPQVDVSLLQEETENSMKRMVGTWLINNPDASCVAIASCLNLSTGTVRAWKAHAKRGTYKDSERLNRA